MKYIKLFETFNISENLKYHLDNNLPILENIFRPGSNKYFDLIREVRELFDDNKIELLGTENEIFESTDIGIFERYNDVLVPLDFPMLNEAEYKDKEVELNKPKRGGTKKYHVYVKDPKSGKVKKISFGDVHGGLTAKVSDPKARKSFAARHQCDLKKDKTTAGYWSCRINRYANIFGKSYPGFW